MAGYIFFGKGSGHSHSPSFYGSDFQNEVWGILCTIPYGQTTTYGAIAKQLAKKKGLDHMSSQAVGGAVGHNEISIIVPCHRVVGANGSLTGYAGGIQKKIKLSDLRKSGYVGIFYTKRRDGIVKMEVRTLHMDQIEAIKQLMLDIFSGEPWKRPLDR